MGITGGGQLGRDVAVVAFTNEGMCMFGSFPVVPMEIPDRALGIRAVERLLARIAGSCAAGWDSENVPYVIRPAAAYALTR